MDLYEKGDEITPFDGVVGNSVVDRHRVDADPDPNPTFHGDADPDPDWYENNTDTHADHTESLTHV